MTKEIYFFSFLFQFHLKKFYNCSFVCKNIWSYIGIRYQKKDNVPQSKTSMMYIFEFYYLHRWLAMQRLSNKLFEYSKLYRYRLRLLTSTLARDLKMRVDMHVLIKRASIYPIKEKESHERLFIWNSVCLDVKKLHTIFSAR